MALSMSLLWGYVVLLSVGRTVFFGLGGYIYAIAFMNIDMSLTSVLLAILTSTGFSVVVRYFVIYAGLD